MVTTTTTTTERFPAGGIYHVQIDARAARAVDLHLEGRMVRVTVETDDTETWMLRTNGPGIRQVLDLLRNAARRRPLERELLEGQADRIARTVRQLDAKES